MRCFFPRSIFLLFELSSRSARVSTLRWRISELALFRLRLKGHDIPYLRARRRGSNQNQSPGRKTGARNLAIRPIYKKR